MFLLDDKPISTDLAFERDGVVYPPGWIALASLEEREAIGITEQADPPFVNHRYYLSDGSPRPIADVQAMLNNEIKQQAQNEILMRYPDWKQRNVSSRGVELTYLDRELTAEENAEVAGFKEFWDGIKALRAHSNALEEEMMALSFEELTTWQQHGWPAPLPGSPL